MLGLWSSRIQSCKTRSSTYYTPNRFISHESKIEGKISRVIDEEIVHVDGLYSVRQGDIVQIKLGGSPRVIHGMAMQLFPDHVKVALFERFGHVVNAGDHVSLQDERRLKVPFGKEVNGRIIDPLGFPLNRNEESIVTEQRVEVSSKKGLQSGLLHSHPNRWVIPTGIRALDMPSPLYYGRRYAIGGQHGAGKTHLARDIAIGAHKWSNEKVHTIVMTDRENIKNYWEPFSKHGLLQDTIFVSLNPERDSSLKYFMAPFTAITYAEHFMQRNERSIVIFDDLNWHANAFVTLHSRIGAPGFDHRRSYTVTGIRSSPLENRLFAVPNLSSHFLTTMYAELLERVFQSRSSIGSITALAVCESSGEVYAKGNVPLTTVLQQVTDRIVELDKTVMLQEKRMPAIPLWETLVDGSEGLKDWLRASTRPHRLLDFLEKAYYLDLSKFFSLRQVVPFTRPDDLDEKARDVISKGERLLRMFHQDRDSYPSPNENAIIFFAAIRGFFKHVPVDDIPLRITQFVQDIKEMRPDLLDEQDPAQLANSLNVIGQLYAEKYLINE